MIARVGLALLLALAACGDPAHATEPPELRIQLNPALARVHDRDPQAARRILERLAAILERPPKADPGTRGVLEPSHERLLRDNPLLQEAYRIDPRAALQQLKDIVAAGGLGT
jgi:hypothetical protein